ncbi:hypothetical protein ACP3V5_08875 [Vibrio maritimus]
MLNRYLIMSLALLFSGCTQYVLYEVPYCLESVKIPRPSNISFSESVKLTEMPCNTVECNEFIINYQQMEMQQLEMITNYVGESQLRFEQYERRVDSCIESNEKVRKLISDKVEESGKDNIRIISLDLGE